ncbi:MAG: hypothetical protein HKN43_00055 [Rhodothermales bacterium]|nr:hypothetical protein [Rhodothermales bacterium]
MKLIALIFCIMIFAIGAVCIVAPIRIVNLMNRHSARLHYYAAGFRILFGAVLVLAAPASRAPDFIYILGIVIIVAGIILLLVGQKRFHTMTNWLAERGPMFVRIWGVIGLLFGCALFYAFIHPA